MVLSGNAAPAHQQGVGFHHAERFTFAEVGGFAAGRVFVRRYRDFMVVLSGIICHTQLFGLKSCRTSPPISHGSSPGHATMIVLSAPLVCQFLLRLLAGFAAHVNLHGGQVGLLERDGIAAAGLPDVRTVSLADADRFVFAGVHPLTTASAHWVEVLLKIGGADRVIQLPGAPDGNLYRLAYGGRRGGHILTVAVSGVTELRKALSVRLASG
jgi:hypothetical protein